MTTSNDTSEPTGSEPTGSEPTGNAPSEDASSHDASSNASASEAPLAYATEYHAPVLSREVCEYLITDPSGCYVDATLGGGGHSAALLDVLDASGRVVGIDQDADAIRAARERLAGEIEAGRFDTIRGNFRRLKALLNEADVAPVDGVLLDLGVSSHQIDTAERGFSFQQDGPLDMRMDDRHGITAHQIVNAWGEREIADVIYEFGDERRSRPIARAILDARPLETTTDLADAVRSAVPPPDEVKTLARVFQALRIAVNTEMDALERALKQSPDVLAVGGRIAVISYHSLEDRRAKRFLRYGNFDGTPVRDVYGTLITPWDLVTRKPVEASDDEVEANPRSRSARLRVAERQENDAGPPVPN